MKAVQHSLFTATFTVAFTVATVLATLAAPPVHAQARLGSTPTQPPARCQPVDAKLLTAPYTFEYGVSPSELQSKFFGTSAVADDGSYNDDGYRPVRLTGYVDNGSVRYATKWIRDGGPEWKSRFGMTGNDFHNRYLALKDQGFMILDASGYNTPAGLRYADIWVKNTDKVRWAVTRDGPANQMDALKLSMRHEGLAPTHVEGYIGATLLPHFIVTWIESPCEWTMDEQLSGPEYQAFFDASTVTMRPIHADAYVYDSSLVRFAGIFWRQNGPAFRATHGQHWYGFQASLNHDSCDGYALDNVYGMELPDQWNAFGGIWSYRGTPSVSAASSLATRVNYRVNCAPGRAGAALINATTGDTVLSHPDQWFSTASGSKPWGLFALLRKADAEDIDLDTTFVGAKTLTTLATEMIVNSNNASTNTIFDYVGISAINDELAALGLEVSRIQRYMTGGGSAHGLGNWFDDFKAGWDNFTTPRELATFWRLVYENAGLLSGDAYDRFLAITGATSTTANNAFDAGYDPASVIFFNKAGSKTYNGVVGDFAHRPQLDTHRIRSEGGVMSFTNGNLVFYAVLSDEADPALTDATIPCVGWEAAREWGGADPGDSGGTCIYP
jgi:hypothetical protein